MRKRIRLTGRKQLPVSCADVAIREVGDKKVVALTINNKAVLKGFPLTARVTLRLVENKQLELLDFGTIDEPKSLADLRNLTFADPSCQLRIVDAGAKELGLLLGSTKTWRLEKGTNPQQGGVMGILRFQPKDIAPRAWKLDIQEDAHPVLQIDERIPDPRSWVRNNPVFIGAVYPAIVQRLFREILSTPDPEDIEWMNDWLRWAESLMPGSTPPHADDEDAEKDDWTEQLIEAFCMRHRLSDRILNDLISAQEAA